MEDLGYEAITLMAFCALGIACVGCLAADGIGRILSRKPVIPYAELNDCNPPAFQASPRATEGDSDAASDL
jgi:hypothetical protein